MRYLKMLLYISSLTATGIVSGIYLWNSHRCTRNCWQSLWSKNDPEFKFPLDGQTIVLDDHFLGIPSETVTRCSVISTKANLRLVHSTSCRMITDLRSHAAIPLIGRLNAPMATHSDWLAPWYSLEIWGAPQILQNQIHVAAHAVKPLIWQSKSFEDESNLPLNFLKMYWQGRMVAVCWYFCQLKIVTGMKSQW